MQSKTIAAAAAAAAAATAAATATTATAADTVASDRWYTVYRSRLGTGSHDLCSRVGNSLARRQLRTKEGG